VLDEAKSNGLAGSNRVQLDECFFLMHGTSPSRHSATDIAVFDSTRGPLDLAQRAKAQMAEYERLSQGLCLVSSRGVAEECIGLPSIGGTRRNSSVLPSSDHFSSPGSRTGTQRLSARHRPEGPRSSYPGVLAQGDVGGENEIYMRRVDGRRQRGVRVARTVARKRHDRRTLRRRRNSHIRFTPTR
jgi:hypothetical protein